MDIIECCDNYITRGIFKRDYSMLFDETTYIGNTSQMSLIITYTYRGIIKRTPV